jgi:hypothetical protein
MVQNTSEWGKQTAKERYGDAIGKADAPSKPAYGKEVNIGLINQPKLDEAARVMQSPQAVNDHHDANYDNDADGWVRGKGKPHPNFDTHKAGR